MKSMPWISIAAAAWAAAAAQGQNILGQFSVPFSSDYGPYMVAAQLAAADGAGGMFLFKPPNGPLRRLDSTGKELWSAPLNIGSLQGFMGGMLVAPDGVYVAGQVNGALPGQTSAGSFDAFAVKYDFNGKTLWTRQFGTADGDYVRA